MTDTLTLDGTPPMVAEYLLPQWKIQADKVAEIDEALNTDGGRTALVKEAVASLGEDNAEIVTDTVTRMVEGLTPGQLFAVDALIKKVLRSVSATVSKYADDNKKEATEVPEAEQKRLREERKAAVLAANAVRTAVIVTNPQWAGTTTSPSDAVNEVFPQFENLRGSVGARKTGPRLGGAYNWAVDGQAVAGQKVGDAAKVLGVSRAVLMESLTKYNAERGIEFDFANPPERFSFVFISGDPDDVEHQLQIPVSATRVQSDDDDDDTSDDDEALLEETDTDDIFDS